MILHTSAKAPGPHGANDRWTRQPAALQRLSEQGKTQASGERVFLGCPDLPAVPAEREPPPPAPNKEPFAGPEAPAPGEPASPESARSVFPLLAIHAESGGTRQGGGDPCRAHGLACAAARLYGAGAALPPELRGLQTEPTWWGSRPHPAPRFLHPPPSFLLRPSGRLRLGYPAPGGGGTPGMEGLGGLARNEALVGGGS